MMKWFKRLLPYFGWTVGIGLVIYLVSRHPLFFSSSIGKLPVQTIIAIAAFNILANICQGIRYYFLWPDGRLPILKNAFLPFCMHSANIILPFRGGETVQPLFIRKWDPKQKLKSLFYWVIVDKFLEFFAMFPFIAGASWYYSTKHFVGALCVWGVAAMLVFIWARKTRRKPRNLPMAYLFATLSWVFNFLFFFTLFSSLQASLSLLVGTSIGSAIPGFPAAIGTYEYTFIWVSERVGIRQDHATVWAVASHSISILSTLLIGIPLGAAWGWPSEQEHIEAAPQRTPKKHRISNVFVFILGLLTLLFTGALWSDPVKRAKKAGEPA